MKKKINTEFKWFQISIHTLIVQQFQGDNP